MSDIFLSRIAIYNFRTFGDFEIEVPAAPGLVLLTGTNGLGKSSFFDAIEWGLTKKIERFEPYLKRAARSSSRRIISLGAGPSLDHIAYRLPSLGTTPSSAALLAGPRWQTLSRSSRDLTAAQSTIWGPIRPHPFPWSGSTAEIYES